MRSFEDFKKKALKDPKVLKAYNDLDPEFAIIKALIEARINSGLTQKKLAQKIGTKQSAIARLETGNANPTLGFLKKLATALDSSVRLSIVKN